VRIADLDEGMIEKFTEHLKRCRCHGFGGSHRQEPQNGTYLFLNYARIVGKVTSPVVEKISVVPELLTSFDRWMRQERGTSDATLNNHALYLRVLLSNLGEDPANYDACKLRQFVLDISRHRGWGAAKACTTALRMFIRFLIVDGKCRPGLEAAIPVVAHWRLSSLPRYLKPEEVEQVIAACDPVSPVRKRNRAILLLLARLGLRVGDILKLRMGDIDWKDACIRVSGKSCRQTLLPLTQEVGDSIVSYIREGRPSTDSGFLFIRSCAPFREFANQKAISAVVARAMRRAGIKCPSRGAAHVLRHSIASSMLRNGATLREIADVLRHRSIKTTEIYAKVDVDALGQIAQPWPEVRVC
jgi:site-specific recombinase XerD